MEKLPNGKLSKSIVSSFTVSSVKSSLIWKKSRIDSSVAILKVTEFASGSIMGGTVYFHDSMDYLSQLREGRGANCCSNSGG